MAEMDKIGQAVLDKVKAEAEDIVKEARSRAKAEIAKAEEQHRLRAEERKAIALSEVQEEAARMAAQAQVVARREVSRAKAEVIDAMVAEAKKRLAAGHGDKEVMKALFQEAAASFGGGKVKVSVSARDLKTAQALKEEQGLIAEIVEIEESAVSGGIVVEHIEGGVRVDNTYDTRLDMLLPKLMPEIAEELF